MPKENFFKHLMDVIPPLEELKDPTIYNELMEFIYEHTSVQFHPNKESILPAGAILDRIIFVESGLVRGYSYSERKEKYRTDFLWGDQSFIFNNSFINREPLKFGIQIMEKTTIISMFYHHVEELFLRFPFAKPVMTLLALTDSKYSCKKYLDPDLSAWENLEELKKDYKGIEWRVTREILASIIGISPQHLSRIRKMG